MPMSRASIKLIHTVSRVLKSVLLMACPGHPVLAPARHHSPSDDFLSEVCSIWTLVDISYQHCVLGRALPRFQSGVCYT